MVILVTGGAGFIGTHVRNVLRERGYKILSFDRTVRAEFPDEQFVADLKDREAVFEAVGRVRGVIHLAGLLGTAETIDTARYSAEVNILGGLNVFDAIAHYRMPAVNVAVGNIEWLSSYPISKYAAERLALMYNRERQTEIAVVRGLNVYGPYQKHFPVRKFMPNFIRSALRGLPIKLYGDGEQILDVIYVEDCAEILVRALLDEHGCYDRVLEAGTGLPVTARAVAEMVWNLCQPGTPPKFEFAPMRPGEPARSVTLGNPDTLAPLRWGREDFTPLEEGVRKTVTWYQAHPEFLAL